MSSAEKVEVANASDAGAATAFEVRSAESARSAVGGTATPIPPTRGGTAADAYAQNHAEIQRRQQLAQSDDQNPRCFERTPGAAEPAFKDDAQTHFVWSASHEGMAPRAKSAQHPAVRIYGLFPSHEEALEHARAVAELDPTCSLMISPTHEWTMLPRAPDRLAAAPAHVASVLEAHRAQRETSTREFKENVTQRRAGVNEKKTAPDVTDPQPHDSPPLTTPRRLGRDAEVRDQSLVALTILKDTTQPVGEPIFRVYAAFPTTTEGDAWARAAGDVVVDHDIDLVSTCVWLFVNDVQADKIGKEVYRSEALSSIIANHKKQPQMCENFHKWRQESESEA